MMKRIVIVTVCLAAAVGVGAREYLGDFEQYTTGVQKFLQRASDGIEANPIPVALAIGTFLLTVVYHKAKGKSLRESVEVAATRVTVVNMPSKGEADNAVVQRAKARAMRTQLIADQIGLENRNRKLPEAVVKAEQDSCYTEKALADAKRQMAEKQKTHDEATAKLEALRKEKALGEAELAEIDVELKKLAEVV